MRRMLVATVVLAALALPSVAIALSRVVHGPVGSGGVATIDIQFNLKHGRATKITRLELNNIPASCQGSAATAASYSFPHHIVISKGTFHAKDVRHGGRVTYMVRGHFVSARKPTGKLRIKGTVPGCPSADSGLVSWTATATH
jgi:hypothetical protein